MQIKIKDIQICIEDFIWTIIWNDFSNVVELINFMACFFKLGIDKYPII